MNSWRCRTPMSCGIDVASERAKMPATSFSAPGVILAMINDRCTAYLLTGGTRSRAVDARCAAPPRTSTSGRVARKPRLAADVGRKGTDDGRGDGGITIRGDSPQLVAAG